MKKATLLPTYKDVKDFEMPQGVQAAMIDPEFVAVGYLQLSGVARRSYVQGSAPTQLCELHGGHGIVS